MSIATFNFPEIEIPYQVVSYLDLSSQESTMELIANMRDEDFDFVIDTPGSLAHQGSLALLTSCDALIIPFQYEKTCVNSTDSFLNVLASTCKKANKDLPPLYFLPNQINRRWGNKKELEDRERLNQLYSSMGTVLPMIPAGVEMQRYSSLYITPRQMEIVKPKNLKGQLETQKCLIASMQSSLNELADRNAEYKKQLDIRQVLSVTVDSVKYGIASAEGNAKTGNVIVTLMALNTGEDAYPKILHGASLNDYDGNIYQCPNDSMSVGGLSNYEVLRKNINTKITLKFTNIPANTSISNLSFYGGGGTTLFSLRDIKIDWK